MADGTGMRPARPARAALWLLGLHLVGLAAVGIGLILQEQWLKQPVFAVKGVAPTVSSRLFADMVRMELPMFASGESGPRVLSGDNVLAFLVQLLTDVNPRDARSLMAGALPGIRDDAVPLKGRFAHVTAPIDYAPPPGLFERQNPDAARGDAAPGGTEGGARSARSPDEPAGPPADGAGGARGETAAGSPDGGDTPSGGEKPAGGGPATGAAADAGDGDRPARPDTGGRKVVLIYHSHNRESWVPELKNKGVTDIQDAFDAETNITLVGRALAERLEELGIGAVHSDTDYYTEVKDYNWNFSYKYSEKTVEAAMQEHRDLAFLFDIHRDSQRRDVTTATIDGETYAQVYFIIGRRNPHWKDNEAFAGKLHDALERLKPGISRGIWGKGAGSGNGEYNQSLSKTSVLIEIGGPENTLEECLRTAEVLAEAIAEVYWEAVRVSGDG
jgi:stage II sporulation protein P